jgi:hypothetical protein
MACNSVKIIIPAIGIPMPVSWVDRAHLKVSLVYCVPETHLSTKYHKVLHYLFTNTVQYVTQIRLYRMCFSYSSL